MATYNCSDSTNSAYGESSYGTCTGQSVGAPNTGVFGQFIDGGTFTVIVPLAVAIMLSIITSVVIGVRRKRRSIATNE